jgi:hypothetical protein
MADLRVEGPPGASGFARVEKKSGKKSVVILGFDEAGIARSNVPFGRSQLRRVVLGVGNGNTAGDPITLAYSLRLAGSKKVNAVAPNGPSTTIFGTAGRLSGRVECREKPAESADVLVTETEVLSGQQQIHEVETDRFGTWSIFIEPQANSSYVAEVVDPLLSKATSEPTTVGVKLLITLELATDRVEEGSSVAVFGDVAPIHAGVTVTVECRRPEREWQPCSEATTDASGGYGAAFPLPGVGIWEVRARVESTGDEDHLPGASVTELIDVQGAAP